MSRWTAAVSLAIALSVPACGAPPDQATPSRSEADPDDAPVSFGAPDAASTAADDAPSEEDVQSLVELLKPPEGVETARIVNEGSTLLRWSTPEPIEVVNAYYEEFADDLGFVLIGTGAGGKSWVFEASEDLVANGSVQVSPMSGQTAVAVTLDVEVGD